jgi:hypothetical protein
MPKTKPSSKKTSTAKPSPNPKPSGDGLAQAVQELAKRLI